MDKHHHNSYRHTSGSQSLSNDTPRNEEVSSLAGGGDSGKGYEEAFYLKSDGSPLKYLTPSVKTSEVIDPNKETTKKMPQLLQLDLRFDQLRVFLESMQKALNQHAQLINGMQGDNKLKSYDKNMGVYLAKIANALPRDCGERPHSLKLDDFTAMEDMYNTTTDDSQLLKASAAKLSEKVEIIGANILKLQNFRKATNQRLTQLDETLPNLITRGQFKEKKKKMKKDLQEILVDKLGDFQERMTDFEKLVQERTAQFENKVRQNEMNTVWRIRDCEELLKQRVSEKFVLDGMLTVEQRVKKEIQMLTDKNLERLERSYKELREDFTNQNEAQVQKTSQLKEHIKEIETKLNKDFVTSEKLIIYDQKMKEIKTGYQRETEELQKYFRQLEEKNNESQRKITDIMTVLAEEEPAQSSGGRGPQQQMPTTHQQQTTPYQQNPGQDKSKANSGGNVSQTAIKPKKGGRGMNIEHENRLNSLDEQMKKVQVDNDLLKKYLETKADRNELMRLSHEKMDREEALQLLPAGDYQQMMKNMIKNELGLFQKNLNDMTKTWDMKLVKLRQDVDPPMLRKRIEETITKGEFENETMETDSKIQAVDKNLLKLSIDFENFHGALGQIYRTVFELQEAHREVLVGKKSFNCLSCGKGDAPYSGMQGKDGKIYKGEMSFKSHQQSLHASSVMDSAYKDQELKMAGPNIQLSNQRQSRPSTSMREYSTSGQKFKVTNRNQSTNATISFNKSYIDQPGGSPRLRNKASDEVLYNQWKEQSHLSSMNGLPQMSHSMTTNHQSSHKKNQSFGGGFTGGAGSSKRLPLGFQVQNKMRDLYQVSGNQRPDSAKR